MKKNNRKKFLRIIGFIIKFLYILSLVIIVFALFVDKGKSLYHILGYSFITVALIAIFLTYRYPESIDLPKVKAFKFKKSFKNNVEFIKYLDNNVSRIKYNKYDLNSYNNFTAYYYVRKGFPHKKVEFFVVLERDQINGTMEEFLNNIGDIRNKIINDIEYSFSIKVRHTTFVSENYILLVNNETDNFKKLLNTNIVGGYRYAFLVCGYSFNSQTLYVANQKDGQYFNYKYIRRKFLKVMNLKMKNRIK